MKQFYISEYNNLQLGDRLIREKDLFSKHHGIYIGIYNGVPLVAENQIGKGVQYISLYDFLLGNSNNLIRIVKFQGTEGLRKNIIPRINQLIGRQYSLLLFNCEHFAELIQNGKPNSKQVGNTLVGLGILTLIGLAIGSNNNSSN